MDTFKTIVDSKIIAIIRGAEPADVLPIAKALYEGGIRAVEIALNSKKALSSIEEVASEMGDDMKVGAGTALDPESARAALIAGASFVLAPSLNPETIKITKRYGAVSIPGAFTPTEILQAYELGADLVKVFPASTLGPGYVKDLHGPLAQIPLLPTGGIDLSNVGAYIKAGAAGVGVASSLVNTKQPVTEDYLEQLTAKAKQFVFEVKQSI
ncbi:bifunctional 4-hydroxy-2-oxoglutarate aldolase/2-dehydro-3-deoxy-phosphogluconate aldolase [Heyndrickxia ginsengihumi]|uniref:2-dehydro-3-deoxyphosphogluconate aldolase n=1 Tax=Heyndrickxia ginsengihumi TaxID=363870 RepID=A0A0A6VFE3_9BACI|nr:bifunctional 4-hydroxy-2-oxoglutarate aldolase/2-dehydro-3-deoxy-phosphogluconate aldolase [Heyndrickxia ginsengihumi]KHD85294.1 2-dehydro-3-deoxyphosphogluconate aldolase [Heyndrickxia ginsengihumi]MBE6185228.1 bifunctional 4-hydroxy-2-oxoglutarate aldolase/2-dehydro-3-deoxy-phosphogluconate aldolase [Bacillus sp. (in: firmicutes)]NEY19346.1 bifunctional 4-hydroxy-2-oxoglutarate aldolase/2-dehydro-3-deoxy-phosphogluconate aldolase [Heyndrickxia ginsengihumi]